MEHLFDIADAALLIVPVLVLATIMTLSVRYRLMH
jgi:hypothetical protein